MTFFSINMIFNIIVTAIVRQETNLPWGIFAEIPFFFYATFLTVCVWYTLVFQNNLAPEIDAKAFWIRHPFGGTARWNTNDLAANPWNRGWKENLKMTMGPWYLWPFFWISPPMTKLWYNHEPDSPKLVLASLVGIRS
jgi:hypothetical protein